MSLREMVDALVGSVVGILDRAVSSALRQVETVQRKDKSVLHV